jgi:NAD(P)H-hydrate epimerase
MRIVNQKEMKEIENLALTEFAYDECLIVENVGIQGANLMHTTILKNIDNHEVLFLIGKGNNGADGLAIARHLQNKGHSTRAFIFDEKDNCQAEMLKQLEMAKNFGVKINQIDEIDDIISFYGQNNRSIILVDALFGTGTRLPLSNFYYDVINFVNDSSELIIAIDIPTGVSGDKGMIQGNAIKADYTLAVGLPKLGYYQADGPQFVGEIVVLDVGLPQKLIEDGDKFLLSFTDLIETGSKRNKFADKKTYGHTLVIGGSHGLVGGLVMAAKGALKVGAGLVTAVTWENQYSELTARLIPEIMSGYIPLDLNKWPRLIKDLDKYDAIVIGPGLARSTRARKLTLEVLNNFDGPVVLDADAINVLNVNEDAEVFSLRNGPTVITPHFGEFARFSGIKPADLALRPVEYLKELIEKINCAVILKGPCSYLGFPDGNIYFNFFPNDGMATGGVGDVLAGILGGLLGQEKDLKEKQSLFNRYENFNKTISLAVLLHSMSGKIAAEKFGVRPMSATSIIDVFSETFQYMDQKIDEVLANGK